MTQLTHLVAVERWGSIIERETRRRVHLCVATYAYEVADQPIMSDGQWDELAQKIDTRMGTGHPLLDEYFLTEFSPMTGLWIHDHPELEKVRHAFDTMGSAMREFYALN